MFELEKSFSFEAGHALYHHDGKCRRPHGHSYLLTVHIRSPELITEGSKRNMVMDFNDLSEIVQKLIDNHLDHHWLNETLQNDSPTAEFIARWIFNYLKPQIPLLTAISLQETASSKVIYRPG